MLAILSDIHGNLEALAAVLADAQTNGATDIFCLGDIVGYGPDPVACVEHAMSWPVVLMGNFDQAAISDDDLAGWTSPSTKNTILQFRQTLIQHDMGSNVGSYLRERPTTYADDEAFYVHGTTRDPLYEYLWPEDVYNPKKLNAVAQGFDKLCFCGHTHLPGIFFRSDAGEWNYVSSEECEHRFIVGSGKRICNVGSVGQPRDSNPRACYVLYGNGNITFRRVDYDIDRTIAKINGNDDFDGILADRLREGR